MSVQDHQNDAEDGRKREESRCSPDHPANGVFQIAVAGGVDPAPEDQNSVTQVVHRHPMRKDLPVRGIPGDQGVANEPPTNQGECSAEVSAECLWAFVFDENQDHSENCA